MYALVQIRVRLVDSTTTMRTMVQRNMKARLLAVFVSTNVILSLMLVPEVRARSTSRRNEDSDAVSGPEKDTFFDSPDLNPSPVDAKKTDDEIMRTAETYFRPLSRYRELQKEKQEKQRKKQKYHSDNEVAAAAIVPVANVAHKVYDTKLLSRYPEYCLPVNNGVVCFYKI